MGKFQTCFGKFIINVHTNKFINYYENHYDELTTPGSEVYESVVHDFTIWGWCQIDPATCGVAKLIFLKINGKNELNFALDLFEIIDNKKPVSRKDFDKLCEIAFNLIKKDGNYEYIESKDK